MTISSVTASSARSPRQFLFVQWVDGRVVAEFPWAAAGEVSVLLGTALRQAKIR